MQLTPEQQFVIKELIQIKKPVQSLGGYAGTGKTTVIKHLDKLLPNWAVCAYTGKAANVLRKKGLESSTIHSLIYKPDMDDAGHIKKDNNGSPMFVLNPDFSAEGILCDEASMVNKEIYQDLLSFNKPIIFVGDHGQLEPIGSDINLMANPDYRLEQIHRNAGPIAYFAEFVRKGYRPAAYTQGGDVVTFIDKRYAESVFNKVNQIICGFNRSRVDINKEVRKAAGYPDKWPVLGEKVMCLRNNKQLGLFNGMQGTVEHLASKPKNKMTFFSDGISYDVLFDPHSFNKERQEQNYGRDDPMPFEFCYAATCHKCQGDEFDKVLVIEQKCKSWDFRRWAYTAASRAKTHLVWAI
jgi:exodeoxyribonuclease-5